MSCLSLPWCPHVAPQGTLGTSSRECKESVSRFPCLLWSIVELQLTMGHSVFHLTSIIVWIFNKFISRVKDKRVHQGEASSSLLCGEWRSFLHFWSWQSTYFRIIQTSFHMQLKTQFKIGRLWSRREIKSSDKRFKCPGAFVIQDGGNQLVVQFCWSWKINEAKFGS